MEFVAAIDPVTRVEGHLKVQVTIDTVNGVQQVVDAQSVGALFRGFEKILVGRDPRDAQHITQRICGVCPVAHSMTAVLALDKAFGVTAPENARILRNLVNGANYVDSHILHFYLLALPDFIVGPGMQPWQPTWQMEKRFDSATEAALIGHYVAAVAMKRKAQEMGALFGGRMPHPPAYLPGGFTAVPTAEKIAAFKAYLAELTAFVNDVYLRDAELLAAAYPEYFSIGRGSGNLLAFGVFELDAAGSTKLLRPGRIANGASTAEPVDVSAITEHVKSSWYDDATTNRNPAVGETEAQYPKAAGYSWLKAPRYREQPHEVGPLARMAVNGDYTNGISAMDRHRARAYETLKIAKGLSQWIDQLQLGQSVYTECAVPQSAQSYGLSEAPRGALGHWLEIANGRLARYQIITPTCWNCSPRDDNGVTGPLEGALIGTPVRNIDEPVEVLRVIHSMDPCLDCAVHAVRPTKPGTVFAVGPTRSALELHPPQAMRRQPAPEVRRRARV